MVEQNMTDRGGGTGDTSTNNSTVYKGCLDSKGNWATHGHLYIPFDDPCKECQCKNGEQEMCRSVLCQPPPHCINPKLMPDTCCQFICKCSIICIIHLPLELFKSLAAISCYGCMHACLQLILQ